MKSLRFKINCAILFTCAAIALLFGAILYPFEKSRYNSHVRQAHVLLDSVYQQKKEELANELFAKQARALRASLEEMLRVEGIMAANVYLADGRLFFSTQG